MNQGTADQVVEDAARLRMLREGHSASAWSSEPGERYIAHRHDYDKVLVVARGDIAFGLPEIHRTVRLVAGDRLDLPAGTLHDASVGRAGATCLEAHERPGTLDPVALHRPGWARTER
jgi:quercetin dioxygenase-like cupin family protein